MIVFFHILYTFTRYLVNDIATSLKQYNKDSKPSVDCSEAILSSSKCFFAGKDEVFPKLSRYEDSTGNLRFFPPVYVQRYEAVSAILQDERWSGQIQKVVDFGCAELGFFMYLKQIPGMKEVLEVDIDEFLVDKSAFKAAPLNADYLSRNRAVPLEVKIYSGSVSDYDECLSNTDAVVAIELIEHLYPDTLNKMPYNVFELMKPRLAVFTTPNADFNQLFPNFVGFRHDDHKFEWTRREFYDWAQHIINSYPDYKVQFYGIGPGPEGTESLGCCSQMAVFERCDKQKNSKAKCTGSYKLICSYQYPGNIDSRSWEDKVLDEVKYYLHRHTKQPEAYNYDEARYEVPLQVVLQWVAPLCLCIDQLREVLMNSQMRIEKVGGKDYLIYLDSESKSDLSEDGWPDEAENLSAVTQQPSDENWDWGNSWEEEWGLENPPDRKDVSDMAVTQDPVRERKDEQRGGGDVERVKNGMDKKAQALAALTNVYIESFNEPCIAQTGAVPRGERNCSKIPRKRNFAEIARNPPVSEKPSQASSKHTVRPHSSYIRKSPRKIAKSFSLDSCLENINCEPVEVQAFYLNLISGGVRRDSSKFLANDSSSPLVDSSSCEKAVDSGYPFSFSPLEADLTPEQVDELVTENDITSARSSTSEESIEDEDEGLDEAAADRVRREVFVEAVVVENGDVANNNRDGEGNNVEGVAELLGPLPLLEPDPNDNNMMMFPEAHDPFPHWLLNMVRRVAPAPVLVPFVPPLPDEGLGDDSSSDCNHSMDLEEVEFEERAAETLGDKSAEMSELASP